MCWNCDGDFEVGSKKHKKIWMRRHTSKKAWKAYNQWQKDLGFCPVSYERFKELKRIQYWMLYEDARKKRNGSA